MNHLFHTCLCLLHIILDNFSSIIAVPPSPVPNASNAIATTASLGGLPKVAAIVVKTPSASPSFAPFNNNFGVNTSASTTAASSADFFDAFHDNFNNKSPSATPTTSQSNNNEILITANNADQPTNIDIAFGAFDPFGAPATAATAALDPFATATVQGTSAFATDFNNDFFTSAFEDEFSKLKVPNASANGQQRTNHNNNSSTRIGNQMMSSTSSSDGNISDFAKFDAFTDVKTTTTTNGNGNNGHGFESTPDPFGDRFDEAFGAAAMGPVPKVDNFTASFAKGSNISTATFSGIGSAAQKKSNNNELAAAGAALKNPRYASDYSQGEAFDKDLQEALQRSMVDQ